MSDSSYLIQHHELRFPKCYLCMLFTFWIAVRWKLGSQIDVTGPLRKETQGEEFRLLRVQPSEGNSGFLG